MFRQTLPSISSRVISLLVTTSILTLSRASNGYVQSLDEETGAPLRWQKREILLTLSAKHRSRDLSEQAVVSALNRAAAAWTTKAGCEQVVFRIASPSTSADRARRDGVNAVLIHEKAWCRGGIRSPYTCYDREDSAVTTTYLNRDEESEAVWISEVDIEINAVDNHLLSDDAAPRAGGSGVLLSDLFVHELGHALGLAHNCDEDFLSSGLVDHEGHVLPRCDDSALTQTEAMAPYPAPTGEPMMLSRDERRAVCDIYAPQSADMKTVAGTLHRLSAEVFPALLLLVLTLGWFHRFVYRRSKKK